jgi:glycerol uptake facilitator-like aquaporin
VIILLVGPVSGAHINPVISLADWWIGRRSGSGLRLAHVGCYADSQIVGAVIGACLANLIYDRPAVTVATTTRDGWNLLLSEIVATAGLVALVLALARSGRTVLVGPAVGAYIGAAYWFIASTSFANPAVTIGRMFSDTFAGIAPNPGSTAGAWWGAARLKDQMPSGQERCVLRRTTSIRSRGHLTSASIP